MDLKSNIFSIAIPNSNYHEIVRKLDSDSSLKKLSNEQAKYETQLEIRMKAPFRIRAIISVENNNDELLIRCDANMIKLIVVLISAVLIVSSILFAVYDVYTIASTIVFAPLAIIIMISIVYQIRNQLKNRLLLILKSA